MITVLCEHCFSFSLRRCRVAKVVLSARAGEGEGEFIIGRLLLREGRLPIRLTRRRQAMLMQHAEPTTGEISAARSDIPAYAWVVFALTVGLLLSDYMSRQVLNAVFPLLKATWDLSDTRLGSLSSVVALMVGVLTFPLSVLADRWGRVKSIVLMAA